MVDVQALAEQIFLEESFLPTSYTSDNDEVCLDLRPDQNVDLDDSEIINILKKYPNKSYRIGDVADVLNLKVHVVRYWENEFKSYFKPGKSKGGQRLYTLSDIEFLFNLKKMIHNEKYSIAGAKKRLKEFKYNEVPNNVSREVLVVLKEELEEQCENIITYLNKLRDSYPRF